ncbi:hypothetical protein CL614_07665 [archaeon]|nr:hypothetical protein [archaeon]|tara:strand:+ start:4741 stop:7068 length:2328 start_codon:yes stop_codon:yes gene_type:complete
MAFQVSPGVSVTEIDATNVLAPSTSSNTGFAAAFIWGPADKIVSITSEQDLANTFGKPTNTDVEGNWHVASSTLAYGGSLNVVRTLGTNAKNALDGTSTEGTIVDFNGGVIQTVAVVAGGSSYTDATGLATTGGTGSGATVDIDATGGEVLTVTVNNAGTGYSEGDILTITQGGSSGGQFRVESTDGAATLGASGTDFTASTAWNGGTDITTATASGVTSVLPLGGSGATFTITTNTNGTKVKIITIANAGSGYNSGDVITVVDPGSTNNTIKLVLETISGSGGVLVVNEEDFDSKDSGSTNSSAGTSSFVARYAGALGNAIQVRLLQTGGSLAGWNGDYTQGGATKTVDFGGLFDRMPNTSDYVLNNNGGEDVNDEIHLVVVDRTGEISGIAGTVLERYAHLSLATDAKNSQGNSNYFKDVIRRDSKYIYATGQWDNVQSTWEGKNSANTTIFTSVNAQSLNLAGGVSDDDSGAGGGNNASKRYSATTGYGLFVDKEAVDIDLLPIGVDSSGALAISVIDNIAKIRKDCIVFLSPDSASVIGTGITKAADVVTDSTQTGLSSTSYAVMDSGWKRTYNRYTDKYIDIPLNGDVAGLCVSVDNSLGAWWSPAGLNRGAIRNVVKLHFDPNKTERDTLYKANINPVANISGAGTILYGDKTFLKKPSAFDRINVRRLFNLLERTISSAAKYMLFEFNDEFTRSSFRNMVEPFLSGIKAKRGIYDFKVVCDSSNNTSDVIDRNEFVGDIYIKPARSINYIQLNFIAVRTGVSFSEVAG